MTDPNADEVLTVSDIDALLADIGAFGFADLPSDQRRQRTAELLDLSETALIILRARLALAQQSAADASAQCLAMRQELDAALALVARQREWIDGVMGQDVVGYKWAGVYVLAHEAHAHHKQGAAIINRPAPFSEET